MKNYKSLKNIVANIKFKENTKLIDSLNQRFYMTEAPYSATIKQHRFSIDWKAKSADDIMREFSGFYNQYAMSSNGCYWPETLKISPRNYVRMRSIRLLHPSDYACDRTIMDYMSSIYNLTIEACQKVSENELVME